MKPAISYIICSTPRSGSHLFADILIGTGVTGRPGEYLRCDDDGRLQNRSGPLAEHYGKKDLLSFRDLVVKLSSTPNKVFGTILMWPYFDAVIANFRTLPDYRDLAPADLIDKLFYRPKAIWLTRQDKVQQAVSWVKAKQTDTWINRGHDQAAAAETDQVRVPRFGFHRLYGRVLPVLTGRGMPLPPCIGLKSVG